MRSKIEFWFAGLGKQRRRKGGQFGILSDSNTESATDPVANSARFGRFVALHCGRAENKWK